MLAKLHSPLTIDDDIRSPSTGSGTGTALRQALLRQAQGPEGLTDDKVRGQRPLMVAKPAPGPELVEGEELLATRSNDEDDMSRSK